MVWRGDGGKGGGVRIARTSFVAGLVVVVALGMVGCAIEPPSAGQQATPASVVPTVAATTPPDRPLVVINTAPAAVLVILLGVRLIRGGARPADDVVEFHGGEAQQ